MYIAAIIDDDESELGILDLITIIVEAIENMFQSTSEDDLVSHPDKVNALLDEIIIGGIVIETNINEINEEVRQ